MTQRYDTYKDSGVQWLGEIPGHWKTIKVGRIFSFVGGNAFNSDNYSNEDTKYQLVRIGNVKNDRLRLDSSPIFISPSEAAKSEKARLREGCILFTMTGTKGKRDYFYTLLLKEEDFNGRYLYLNQRVGCFVPCTSEINVKYYNYLFKEPHILDSIFIHETGTANQGNLGIESINRTILHFPPLPEQHAIVSYLDSKCGKIDEWLEKKQKEVELLGEMKQRAIADAVTRGLDPNAKMKPTNISWLPEVPEHWEMSKISSHFRHRSEKVSDKDYPALSVSKMGITPQLENVALSNAEGASRKLVKVGDYAVNSRSDRKGSCGVSKYEGSVSLITIVLEPFGVDGEYIHYLFRSTPWVEEFYRNGRGIVADLWTTNYQMMKGMYFPVPPLSEQRAIVSYITSRTAKIEKMIGNINREIENLKEYKQRLISDVVTGQIKVINNN